MTLKIAVSSYTLGGLVNGRSVRSFETHMQRYFANRKASAYPISLSEKEIATSLISKPYIEVLRHCRVRQYAVSRVGSSS